VRQRLRLLYEQGRPTGWVKPAWPFLVVLSWCYALCVKGLRLLYRMRIGRAYRPRAKVVSVGNIVMGGTGKTPLVRLVVEHLYRRDKRVAVLLRGYRRPADRKKKAVSDFHLLGDEGAWLKQVLCAKADVFAAPDRKGLARQVDATGRYEVLVLDDGFQHWRLKRDLDIVTVDATRGLGNGFMIPAGPLREEGRALARAHVVCLTRTDEVAATQCRALKEHLRRLAPRAALVELAVRPKAVTRVKTGAVLDVGAFKGKAVGIFCGIARPASFRRTLQAMGANVVYEKSFEDHHVYTQQEIDLLVLEAAGRGATVLCTTEKDAVRLEGIAFGPVDISAVAVEPGFVCGQEVFYGRLDSLFSV